MLEFGEFPTIAEPAEREGIAPSYMTRVLRLTLLARDIVKALLNGKQGAGGDAHAGAAALSSRVGVSASAFRVDVWLLPLVERCLHFSHLRSML